LKSNQIKYYSTNLKSPEVTLREALLNGLAPDGGLYMPSVIPKLDKQEIQSFSSKDYYEIAYTVLNIFLNKEIESEKLMSLCQDAYNFDVPLENVHDNNYLLRLDQGPSASFKDFAARMMARLMHYFTSSEKLHFSILTATSGDTGSAVASAFHGLKNIDVIILFPVNEVTEIQRKQMTTLGDNVLVIGIDGKFDDCQNLVKRAFRDSSLSSLSLTSANSINIGRLLPQSIYYFYAWSKVTDNIKDQIIFSVPSGNYGNLMGGIIAREMGLPVKKLIISANLNDEVPVYLKTGIYRPISPSINCISSAMNVGHPSNFARIIALYGGMMNEKGIIIKEPDLARLRNDFFGVSISDDETRKTIAGFYEKYRLMLEPHGAVAWKGLECFQKSKQSEDSEDMIFVSLETAHPSKFREEVLNVLGIYPEIPDSLNKLENKKEEYTVLENNYEKLRDLIRKY
jgi:threonine synthase